MCARKLSEGAAVAAAFSTASDSEIGLGVLAKGAVVAPDTSVFGRIGCALTRGAGSPVLVGAGLVAETVRAGVACGVEFGIPFEQIKVGSRIGF